MQLRTRFATWIFATLVAAGVAATPVWAAVQNLGSSGIAATVLVVLLILLIAVFKDNFLRNPMTWAFAGFGYASSVYLQDGSMLPWALRWGLAVLGAAAAGRFLRNASWVHYEMLPADRRPMKS
jgi:hypothetical protein